ncbi:hypothetical protein Q1695_013932 [Nippostrongylus brasiliensis]|nr:hypothetical protein Q1695_013932 [Nippostrongylus brasiliensis]
MNCEPIDAPAGYGSRARRELEEERRLRNGPREITPRRVDESTSNDDFGLNWRRRDGETDTAFPGPKGYL